MLQGCGRRRKQGQRTGTMGRRTIIGRKRDTHTRGRHTRGRRDGNGKRERGGPKGWKDWRIRTDGQRNVEERTRGREEKRKETNTETGENWKKSTGDVERLIARGGDARRGPGIARLTGRSGKRTRKRNRVLLVSIAISECVAKGRGRRSCRMTT